ncbi:MAG: alpha/beta fold hydrolase [Acidimicrobiales bacterium]
MKRGGSSTSPSAARAVPAAPAAPGLRLARHGITLDDGHRVGVAVCGQGMPVVLVHGLTAEGILYAQTLSRLVKMGFKVVAVDMAGHGATDGLPSGGANLACYADLLARVLDRLGLPRAVLAGHSLGGRLVTQLVAAEPHRAVAVVLIDAAVGEAWDRLVDVSRLVPPVLAGMGALLVVDTLSTLPFLRDPGQALKLGRLVAPTVAGHLLHPWRMVGPAVSLLRSRSSRPMLEALARQQVPVVVIHGDRDLAVPYRAAKDAARASGGWLVTVHGGTHAWLLKDPESFPAIIAYLLGNELRTLWHRVVSEAGLDPDTASFADIEDRLVPPDALVRTLTPATIHAAPLALPPRRARYRWTVTKP